MSSCLTSAFPTSSVPSAASRPSTCAFARSTIARPTACAPTSCSACSPTTSSGTCAVRSRPSSSTMTTSRRAKLCAPPSCPQPSARRAPSQRLPPNEAPMAGPSTASRACSATWPPSSRTACSPVPTTPPPSTWSPLPLPTRNTPSTSCASAVPSNEPAILLDCEKNQPLTPKRPGNFGLAPCPSRLALAREGARTFSKVLAFQHGANLVIATADRGHEARCIEASHRCLLGRAHRERRTLEDLIGPAPGGCEELAMRDHLVHEAQGV